MYRCQHYRWHAGFLVFDVALQRAVVGLGGADAVFVTDVLLDEPELDRCALEAVLLAQAASR